MKTNTVVFLSIFYSIGTVYCQSFVSKKFLNYQIPTSDNWFSQSISTNDGGALDLIHIEFPVGSFPDPNYIVYNILVKSDSTGGFQWGKRTRNRFEAEPLSSLNLPIGPGGITQDDSGNFITVGSFFIPGSQSYVNGLLIFTNEGEIVNFSKWEYGLPTSNLTIINGSIYVLSEDEITIIDSDYSIVKNIRFDFINDSNIQSGGVVFKSQNDFFINFYSTECLQPNSESFCPIYFLKLDSTLSELSNLVKIHPTSNVYQNPVRTKLLFDSLSSSLICSGSWHRTGRAYRPFAISLNENLEINWFNLYRTENDSIDFVSNNAFINKGNIFLSLYSNSRIANSQFFPRFSDNGLVVLDSLGEIETFKFWDISQKGSGSYLHIKNNGTLRLSFLNEEYTTMNNESPTLEIWEGGATNFFDHCNHPVSGLTFESVDIDYEIIPSTEIEITQTFIGTPGTQIPNPIIEDIGPLDFYQLCPYLAPPNAEAQLLRHTACINQDSFEVELSICNTGAQAVNSGLPVRFYNLNPTRRFTRALDDFIVDSPIEAGACAFVTARFSNTDVSDSLFAVINDDGSWRRPYHLDSLLTTSLIRDTLASDNLVGIDIQSSLDANYQVVNSSPDQSTGALFLEFVNGFHPPYTYAWSTGDTSSSVTNLPPGDYSVTITDEIGCNNTFDYAVEVSTSTSEPIQKNLWAQVVPNPSSENAVLRFYSENAQKVTLRIHDMNGRLIGDVLKATKNEVPLPNLKAGLYFVHVMQNDGHYSVLKWIVL